jgi:hypothetical protein
MFLKLIELLVYLLQEKDMMFGLLTVEVTNTLWVILKELITIKKKNIGVSLGKTWETKIFLLPLNLFLKMLEDKKFPILDTLKEPLL